MTDDLYQSCDNSSSSSVSTFFSSVGTSNSLDSTQTLAAYLFWTKATLCVRCLEGVFTL